jgi:hypothetical protein
MSRSFNDPENQYFNQYYPSGGYKWSEQVNAIRPEIKKEKEDGNDETQDTRSDGDVLQH